MTILPTPRLIVMLAVAVPMFLAGGVWDALTAVGVLYLAVLAAYSLLDVMLLPRSRHVTVVRIAPERLSIGERTRITFQLSSLTWREVEVQLSENLPEHIEAFPPRCSIVLDRRSKGSVTYQLRARRRGRYLLSEVDVRVLPRLGLFLRQFTVRLPGEIHVFPNLVNVRRYELLLRRGAMIDQGLARMRQIGLGSEFESLRHYTEGDDLSRIDWKATGKHARLVVKNFEPERHQSILVALDVGRATAGEFQGISRLDYMVNAVLMLAYVALRQGDWFSLVAFSRRIESYLPPVRQVRCIENVARALYELEPQHVESDYAAACRFLGLRHRKRGLICLMTDVIDPDVNADVIGYMARFARRQLPLAVTLANPEVRAVAEQPLASCADPYSKAAALEVLSSRQKALSAMRGHGVGVLDVDPSSLTIELINRYLLIKSTHRL